MKIVATVLLSVIATTVMAQENIYVKNGTTCTYILKMIRAATPVSPQNEGHVVYADLYEPAGDQVMTHGHILHSIGDEQMFFFELSNDAGGLFTLKGEKKANLFLDSIKSHEQKGGRSWNSTKLYADTIYEDPLKPYLQYPDMLHCGGEVYTAKADTGRYPEVIYIAYNVTGDFIFNSSKFYQRNVHSNHNAQGGEIHTPIVVLCKINRFSPLTKEQARSLDLKKMKIGCFRYVPKI